jgi:hypothetical protein
MNKIFLFAFLLFLTAGFHNLYAQNCYKKNLCKKTELLEYDYRSQSSYQTLTTGDTLSTGFVAYENQDYHFLTCSDPKLGQLEIKIYSQKKVTEKVIKEVIINEKNPQLNDTIFERSVKPEYEIIFDNSEDKSINNWEFSSRKTRLLVVNINAPEGKKNYTGCANILIGNKLISSKKRNLR